MVDALLSVLASQLNVTDDCYVTEKTLKAAIVCDLKVVLASPKIALYEKGALEILSKYVQFMKGRGILLSSLHY